MKTLAAATIAASLGLTLQAQDVATPAAAPKAPEAVQAVGPVVAAADKALSPEETAAKAAKAKADAAKLVALIPDVLATYGDKKEVRGDELRKQLQPMLEMQASFGNLDGVNEEMIKKEARSYAEMTVEKTMILDAAAKDGLTPDVAAAKKQLTDMIAQQPMMAEMMKARNMSEDQAVREISEGEVIQKWIETKLIASLVPDAEVRKYYDEHQEEFQTRSISHILIMPKKDDKGEATPAAKDEAKKKIADIQAKLKAGEDFGKLARENSECPSGKQKDGDLGNYAKSAAPFVPEFNEAAFKLKNNETSDIVETQFGYHLIKVSNVSTTAYDKARLQILKSQFGEKISKAIQEKLDAMKKDANIKYNI